MATRYIQPLPFYPAPSSFQARHSHYTVDAARKFAQGAGSALLVFSGADSVANPSANAGAGAGTSGFDWTSIDFTSFEGILGSLVNGPFTGPVQIIAAVMLFLMAGRCVSRFLGLAVGASVLFLYMQGVTVDDAWMFFERFGERITAAAQAFQTADVS
jgi:hypothetical protein